MDKTMNDRLFQIRKSLGMTQEKFGNELGLNKSSISNIEKYIRNVTDKHIKLVSTVFGVNEDWLRTGNGQMFTPKTQDEELAHIVYMARKVENEKLRHAILSLNKLTEDELLFLIEIIKKVKGES